jgi:hypothetical protein
MSVVENMWQANSFDNQADTVLYQYKPAARFMKKVILFLCLCTPGFRALCQQIDIGVIAGGNVSTFSLPADQQSTDAKSAAIVGFHAGILFQFAVGSIYIQPAAIYESIGGKTNAEDVSLGAGPFSDTYSLRYLQVPVNILYHTKSNKFFFGGGPYVAFALSGTVTDNSTDFYSNGSGSTTSNNTFNYKFDFTGSNNPEFGLNLVAGVRVPGNFIFTAGASVGQQNIVFNLSIGRMFW